MIPFVGDAIAGAHLGAEGAGLLKGAVEAREATQDATKVEKAGDSVQSAEKLAQADPAGAAGRDVATANGAPPQADPTGT